MACCQTEFCTTVIDKVIFGIKPTVDKLRILIRIRPRLIATLINKRQVCWQKRPPDILGQCEISGPVIRTAIIHKDATNAACPFAVWNIEILVRPFL